EADLHQQPHPLAAVGDSIGSPPRRSRYPIERRQRWRHEGVAGREQVAIIPPLDQQVIDDHSQRLLASIVNRVADEGGIDAWIYREYGEIVKAENVVKEGTHACLQARAVEHALHCFRSALGSLQIAMPGFLEQLSIRSGVPEEKAQPARQRKGIEPLGARAPRVRLGAIHYE